MKTRSLLVGVTLALTAAVLALGSLPGSAPAPLAARSGEQLQAAHNWGYQLQGARAELMPPEIDLVVIDSARDSGGSDLLSAADVEGFRNRPGGKPRIVLAYMSIGEAETYRAYWWKPWLSKAYLGLLRPSWLARENKDWKGNYLVRFWEPGWQKVMVNPAPSLRDTLWQTWLGAERPYIDHILEAGFDGVYLDRVDAFGEWEKARPTAETDMSTFVQRLSGYAKARKPGFIILAQNGEELAARSDYRRAIDGLAKEDLLFGVEKGERPNDREETRRSVELLRKVQSDGKPVFVVEYLHDPNKRAVSLTRMRELGFIVTFAERELNRPPEQPPTPVLPMPSVAMPTIPLEKTAPAIPKPQP